MTRDELTRRLEAGETGNGCWIWPRKKDARGRGRIWVGDKIMLAHRAIWEHLRGPIPAGKFLCHTCDNPSCVNPAHLYVGTHADNMRDMRVRRRSFWATQPERVREIGALTGGEIHGLGERETLRQSCLPSRFNPSERIGGQRNFWQPSTASTEPRSSGFGEVTHGKSN